MKKVSKKNIKLLKQFEDKNVKSKSNTNPSSGQTKQSR
jgi:hypothetical protein